MENARVRFYANVMICNKDTKYNYVNSKYNIEKICELPVVRSYSDGGGVFGLEEFMGFPEKLYFLGDNVIALRYCWEIVILDVKKQRIITSIEGNLIQSFFVMAESTICFSAGLNTYIVQLELNQKEGRIL